MCLSHYTQNTLLFSWVFCNYTYICSIFTKISLKPFKTLIFKLFSFETPILLPFLIIFFFFSIVNCSVVIGFG